MKEINLREFYPWYMEDVMVEVTEEVAEELLYGKNQVCCLRSKFHKKKGYGQG